MSMNFGTARANAVRVPQVTPLIIMITNKEPKIALAVAGAARVAPPALELTQACEFNVTVTYYCTCTVIHGTS